MRRQAVQQDAVSGTAEEEIVLQPAEIAEIPVQYAAEQSASEGTVKVELGTIYMEEGSFGTGYVFTPQESGMYQLDNSDIAIGYAAVFSDQDQAMTGEDPYVIYQCCFGGITRVYLEAGHTYSIQFECFMGDDESAVNGKWRIDKMVGKPAAEGKNVRQCGSLDYYTFTPAESANYRIDIEGDRTGTAIYDIAGANAYGNMGYLEKGSQYLIMVGNGYKEADELIFHIKKQQNKTVEVGKTYTDPLDLTVFEFSPKKSGKYRIETNFGEKEYYIRLWDMTPPGKLCEPVDL